MGSNYNRLKTWGAEVLTYNDLNAEFDNAEANSIPESIDDYSASTSEMRLQTDPGEVGTESAATKLSGELERLRYAIKEAKSHYGLVTGSAAMSYWYETPVEYRFTQSSATLAGLTITASHVTYTGNVLKLACNEENNGSFNFIVCESDSDGTPANEFVVDKTGNVTCGTVNGATLSGGTMSGGSISGGTMTATEVTVNSIAVTQALVPIGSIIPFYDFDAALTFSTDYWVYCDGGTATVGGSSRTLPDLSGRYLVGFGTDGDGTIDSATWATAAVGAAAHQVDLSHTHTGPSHTHNVATWKVSGAAEWLRFYKGTYGDAVYQNIGILGASAGAAGSDAAREMWSTNGSISDGDDMISSASGTGATGSGGSATQSVQPRSIRCRFIMRKA